MKTVDPRAYENSEMGDTSWEENLPLTRKGPGPTEWGLQEHSYISAVLICLCFIPFLVELSIAIIPPLSHHCVLGWEWRQLTCPFSLQVTGPDLGAEILHFEESNCIMR